MYTWPSLGVAPPPRGRWFERDFLTSLISWGIFSFLFWKILSLWGIPPVSPTLLTTGDVYFWNNLDPRVSNDFQPQFQLV